MRRVAIVALLLVCCGTAFGAAFKPHSPMLFVRDFKAPLYDTQVYILQPTNLSPSTSYTFEFKLDFWSLELVEYLLEFSVQFPPGYTNITATDPPPVDESAYGSHWGHSVSGTKVTWHFYHYCDPYNGWGCGWGDAHVGSSITFTATATTDAAATNEFPYDVKGDMNGTLSGTAYVGGPWITSVSPTWFEAGEADASIVLTFSEPVNPASLDITTDPNVSGWEGSWNGDNTQVTLTHDDFPKNNSVMFSVTDYEDAGGTHGTPRSVLFFVPPDPMQSGFTMTTPVADGFIVPEEWEDASVMDISIQGEDKASLYLMNDSQRLYIGLDVPADPMLSFNQLLMMADQMSFSFDENNDGSFPPLPEDKQTSEEGTYWVLYYPDTIPPVLVSYLGRYGNWLDNSYETDPDYIDTQVGVEAGISAMSGHVQYEAFFDFEESYLNPSEFPGTIGFALFVVSLEGGFLDPYYLYLGQVPHEYFTANPATYMKVNLSSGLAPEVTAIEPNYGSPRYTNPVSIYGMNFSDGCRPYLVSEDGDEVELLEVEFIHAAQVNATVPALLAEGYYDVVVANPDKQKGTLEDGYYVGDKPPDDGDDDDDSSTGNVGGCGCGF